MADGSAQNFREATEKVRQRAEAAAKVLGGLGTAGVTAIGLSKAGDVYPSPDGGTVRAALLIGGLLTMAAVVAGFTYRLWRVNRPLVTRSDWTRIADADDKEQAQIAEIYDREARLNSAPTLRALEARAHRFARIAMRQSADARAKDLRAASGEVMNVVLATQNRAALVVVRRRASRAIASRPAAALYALFVAGC